MRGSLHKRRCAAHATLVTTSAPVSRLAWRYAPSTELLARQPVSRATGSWLFHVQHHVLRQVLKRCECQAPPTNACFLLQPCPCSTWNKILWTSSTIHRRHGLANGVHTPAVNNRARARTQAGCRAPPASPRRHKTPSTSTPPPSTGSPTSNLGAARTCAIPCVPSGRCDALSVPRGTRWPRGSLGPEWGSARSAG